MSVSPDWSRGPGGAAPLPAGGRRGHGRGAERARARLTGDPVDEEEAKRDGELLERWRRSQGISHDVITQRAEEVRARLLMRRE
ncbi:MAG: hypothetical protein M3R38_29205 [Actinomycetota bacterium]|nr:hypothetical protein [Actinomycetota bacterium]